MAGCSKCLPRPSSLEPFVKKRVLHFHILLKPSRSSLVSDSRSGDTVRDRFASLTDRASVSPLVTVFSLRYFRRWDTESKELTFVSVIGVEEVSWPTPHSIRCISSILCRTVYYSRVIYDQITSMITNNNRLTQQMCDSPHPFSSVRTLSWRTLFGLSFYRLRHPLTGLPLRKSVVCVCRPPRRTLSSLGSPCRSDYGFIVKYVKKANLCQYFYRSLNCFPYVLSINLMPYPYVYRFVPQSLTTISGIKRTTARPLL